MVRRTGRFAGRWSLPGGTVEPDEPIEAALRREVREETGLRIRVDGIVSVIRQDDFVILTYRATPLSGRLQAGDDAAGAEWVPLDQVRRKRTTPQLRKVLGRAGL